MADNVVGGDEENNILNSGNGNDLLVGGAGNDTINGYEGNDKLHGEAGNDILYGGNGEDVLTGGVGNDTLDGGYGTDIYVFNLGDGEDVINNYDPTNWKNDRIVFGEGVCAEDIKVYRSGTDLIFKNQTNSDIVKVKDAMRDCDGWYYVGGVEFADGTKWDAAYIQEHTRHYNGTDGEDVLNGFGLGYNYNQNETFNGGAGNDTINGNDGNDELYGGAGNDILNGGSGEDVLTGGLGSDVLAGGFEGDTYIFNLGDGEDVINNYDPANWKNDRMVFGEGIHAEDITLYRSGQDLIFKNQTNSDIVKVKDAMRDCDGWYYVGGVEFADGTKWDAAYIQEHTRHYNGTDGEDVLNGFGLGYNYNQNETFNGGAGNDTINGNDGNDELYGGAGNDILNGGSGEDVLTGGLGSDVLAGGFEGDTYIFNLGDGEDVINNYDPANWKNDRIVFGEGVRAEDIAVYRSGTDLIFKNHTNSDIVKVKDAMRDCDGWYYIGGVEFADGTKWDAAYIQEHTRHYNGTEGDDVLNGFGLGYNYNQNETFNGGAGNDIINGNDGNDELHGEAGNDMLRGGYGNDTYIFNCGDGQDRIEESSGKDTLLFGKDVTKEQLKFSREGNDLKVSILGTEDSVLITNQYYSDYNQIESFKTSDGSTFDYTKIDLMIQAMASFEETTGMMWEEAIEKNEQANDIVNQWWTKEAI